MFIEYNLYGKIYVISSNVNFKSGYYSESLLSAI